MGRPLYDYIVNKIQCTASVEGAVKTLTLVRQIGKARFLATDGNKLFPVNLVSKAEFEDKHENETAVLVAKVGEEEYSVNYITDKLVYFNENDEPGKFVYDLVYADGEIIAISQPDDAPVKLGGIPEVIEPTGEQVVINDPTKDVLVKNPVIHATSSVTANSAIIVGANATVSPALQVKAVTNVNVSDFTVANVTKTQNQGTLVVNANESVTLSNLVFDSTTKLYCPIVVNSSNDGMYPASVTLENVDYMGTAVRNAINIFGTKDNAVITLKNCHFSDCENVLQLFNYPNAKNVTFNLIDCSCDKWDTGIYAGMFCLNDMNSQTEEEMRSNNLFGSFKINIERFKCPDGKYLTQATAGMGDGSDTQVVYLYLNKTGSLIPYAGNEELFPTVTVK